MPATRRLPVSASCRIRPRSRFGYNFRSSQNARVNALSVWAWRLIQIKQSTADNYMHVRDASIRDLDEIVGFIAEEAREAEGRTQDRQTLERGIAAALQDDSIARYWLLVDESGFACGCASAVREWSDWNAGFYWWIQSMYIAPAHRGKGHMNLLMDCIVSAATDAGCLDLRLYVHSDNKAAIRAYEKAGFSNSAYRIMSRSL